MICNAPKDAAVYGVDLGKNLFHVVGLDDRGVVVQRVKFRRDTLLIFFERAARTIVGMEACPGSQWLARKLQAMGYQVRIVPAQFVKPYVKSQKNDTIDAEAIAEAVTRPTMRFTQVRTVEQVDLQALHRIRDQLVSSFTMLLHLPRLSGHGEAPRMKNGPAFAGHGAEAVRDAITRTIIALPEELRRSLTWDQGAEMAQHDRLKIDAGVQVYFCDPQSPWQRGTNENTNGLLRQYFPKGTDLSIHSADEIAAVAAALNARPRKTLGWKTPAEALDEWLR